MQTRFTLAVFQLTILLVTAVWIINPNSAVAEEPYPEVERRIDVSYRCVLYQTELRATEIMRTWTAFRRVSVAVAHADRNGQLKSFDDYKNQAVELVRSSPSDVDFVVLNAELIKTFHEFNFQLVDSEVSRITRELGDRVLEAADASERNDEDLRVATSPAVDVDLKKECGKQ